MFLKRMPLKYAILWQNKILERMRWLVERQHGCVGWTQMVIAHHRHWQK